MEPLKQARGWLQPVVVSPLCQESPVSGATEEAGEAQAIKLISDDNWVQLIQVVERHTNMVCFLDLHRFTLISLSLVL